MDQFIDWVYSQLVGFFGNFFAEMGNMGVELFEMSWVQSIVLFFSYLAWTLYVVGLVVAVFEVGIEYQTGRASIKDAAISAVKGFMAVGCFTLVPVELYKLSVTLQASLTSGITGYGESFDALSTDIINSLQATILTAGLLVLKDHALLGLGLMLSAGEVPRICGAFGLDTSTRANIMSAVYAAQSAVNTTRTVVQAVGAAK